MMRFVSTALLWTFLLTPATSQYLLFAQPSPPPQAAAAGYNTLTFYGQFTPSTVDVNSTFGSGFLWYKTNFVGMVSPGTITLNADATAVLNTTGPSANAGLQWSTAGCAVVSGNNCSSWRGTAFGGGAYFEATIKFDSTLVVLANSWPAFWAVPIERLIDNNGPQWPGQATNYVHFLELDVFEYDRVPLTSGGGSLHEWYGIYNVTCQPQLCSSTGSVIFTVPSTFNYNAYHTYSALWVPATVSTPGSMTFYLDNTSMGQITWDQFTTQTPPPAAYPPKSWTFGVMDNLHFSLILGTGLNVPMSVGRVRVWQKNSTGNLVQ